MDVDESRVNDQDLTILTLVQKQCFDRLQLASLRELGTRLGTPRLALKAFEAHAQLERYSFIDGQPTSMLIRGGELRRVPQGCALSVHFCNLAGWAWNVCKPTLTMMTGWCLLALVTRCPQHWRLPNRWMTLLVLCSVA